MANSKIRLTYFDLNGRAEIIRLVLTWAGKEFEDRRIKGEDWPTIKPTTPFGQLPFVEIDGKTFGQSVAIATYFARVFNLYGKSHLDGLYIDQVAQLAEDLFREVLKVFRESDPAKKADLTKTLTGEIAPKFLKQFENLLKQNNGRHFVGDSVSLADLIVFDLCTGFCEAYTKDALKNFPLLKALVDQISHNDKIKAYRARIGAK